jgi:hypothetical protein
MAGGVAQASSTASATSAPKKANYEIKNLLQN